MRAYTKSAGFHEIKNNNGARKTAAMENSKKVDIREFLLSLACLKAIRS
jgi:hypothetical protein